MSREHYVAARRDDTWHIIETREQSLERARAFGPDLEQHGGVARDVVRLLHFRKVRNRQLRGSLAPAPNVYVDERQERLAYG